MARRGPDRGRTVVEEVALATAWGEALTLRVWTLMVPAWSSTVMTLELANPENLKEFKLRRLPWKSSSARLRTWGQGIRRTGSFEKTGPSGTRFTRKELFRYRLLVRIIGWRNCGINAATYAEKEPLEIVGHFWEIL